MFSYIKTTIENLIRRDTPYRVNAACVLVACAVMAICSLWLTYAAIHTEKNLIAELTLAYGSLTGLSGTAYYQSKKSKRVKDIGTNSKDIEG